MLHTFLAIFLAASPMTAAPTQTHTTEESMHKHINAEQLKSLYDQNTKMIVLDARSKHYFDGTLLPNAIWLPAESTEQEIQAVIPSKSSLVIVYCLGVKCPASGWLYDKLIAMGYDNVYDYHEGLEDWKKRGLPTTKQ